MTEENFGLVIDEELDGAFDEPFQPRDAADLAFRSAALQFEAERQARIAAGVEHQCANCGCSESRVCPGGCVWATPFPLFEVRVMTDEERRNRNPAPEVSTINLADAAEVPLAELELHRVYVVHSARMAGTLNYMGKKKTIHPRTLQFITVYHFHGPRAAVDAYLTASRDGTLRDMTGNVIRVRRYSGPDQ